MLNSNKKQIKLNGMSSIKITCTGIGWQIRNSACNKILIVEPSDIKKRFLSDKKAYVYGIICPNCGCFTIIPEKNITNSIKKR